MRTKDEILKAYDDFKKLGRNSTDLRTFTELTKVEILIDIRDILNDRLDDIDGAINNMSLIR